MRYYYLPCVCTVMWRGVAWRAMDARDGRLDRSIIIHVLLIICFLLHCSRPSFPGNNIQTDVCRDLAQSRLSLFSWQRNGIATYAAGNTSLVGGCCPSVSSFRFVSFRAFHYSLLLHCQHSSTTSKGRLFIYV
jgi:hypothetical protein